MAFPLANLWFFGVRFAAIVNVIVFAKGLTIFYVFRFGLDLSPAVTTYSPSPPVFLGIFFASEALAELDRLVYLGVEF